jgi:hypothetical protein
MTDEIKDLLALVVPDHALPHAGEDAAGDLARGHRAMRRRRLALAAGAAVALGALAGGVATAAGSGVPTAGFHHPASPPPSSSGQRGAGNRAIALVAYGGAQVPGYQVAEVPAGWTIQGGNAYALALAPIGYPNTNIDSFIGKLVVMSESASEVPGQPGAAESVSGQPGRFWTQDGTETLIYRFTASTWVYIQAPPSLGWDAAQLVAFAEGVKVLGNAQQSKG